MNSAGRSARAQQSFSSRMLVPGLFALAVLAMSVLLLAMIEFLSGYDTGVIVLAIATVCGACAITALLAVALANVRLIHAGHIEVAQMNAMMAAMKDGVCCVDERGRLTYMNAAAEQMLGRRFEDYAGAPLASVFPLREHDGVPADKDATMLHSVLIGTSYTGRDAVICGNGALLPVDIRLAPIGRAGEHAGAVLAFVDDTDRSREEQAKDDFVGFASHELRSPLTAVHGFSSWLAKKLEHEPWRFDADTAEAIAALAAETGRMESIIELFLDLTQIRMDRLDLEPDVIDLTKLLREEGAAVRSRYPAAVVEEFLPDERVLAIMDVQRLRQVILNLLDNAAKYGGAEPHIALSLRTSGSFADVRIRDSGSGIPQEDQRHIFERFFRSPAPATEKKKGFGIGLYVTKQIVDRMGGELSFTSEEDVGTEFYLRLPLKREEVEQQTAREEVYAMSR